MGRPSGELWDTARLIFDVEDEVADCRVLWTISRRDRTLSAHDAGANLPAGPVFGRAPAYQVPKGLGFHVVERWQFNYAQVTKSTRDPQSNYLRPK